MIEIPWDGPSVIVPVEAIEMLHKFNHNYNHVPLIQCRDCTFGKGRKQCGCLVLMAVVKGYDMKDHKGFCYLAQLAEACQNTDKEAEKGLSELFGILADKKPTLLSPNSAE